VGPEDLDLAEVQDTDAAREILSAEELGLCPPRGGGRWVRDGGGAMGSRLPVNASGGLLSKGEPLGAAAPGPIGVRTRRRRRPAGRWTGRASPSPTPSDAARTRASRS